MRFASVLVLALVGVAGLVGCGSDHQALNAADTPTVATPTPTRAVVTTASPAATSATPVITKRTVTATEAIPYSTRRVQDSSIAAGKTVVTTRGHPGVRTVTYELTFTNGIQTAKKRIRLEKTTAPVTEVIAVGTKVTPTQPPSPVGARATSTQQASQCDPNYSGACVPIASDVDCAGGSGNGPAYVQGPVIVVGTDIYGLDRDHDGIGCE
jgi:resuscitation-promoting factor RpfB